MIYIFEDMKNDILSEFFRKAYPSEVADKFIYTNGNGGIIRAVKELLETTQDTIIVFLDFYPTNDIRKLTVEEIWDIHRQLVNMFNEIVDKLEPIDSSRKYKKYQLLNRTPPGGPFFMCFYSEYVLTVNIFYILFNQKAVVRVVRDVVRVKLSRRY